MILVEPSVHIEYVTDDILKHIEKAGRTCYKSERLITTDSATKFVKNIIERRHESVLEHANMTVRFICDRGITHELVRHRLASFSQESTRYCSYKKGCEFILPFWVEVPEWIIGKNIKYDTNNNAFRIIDAKDMSDMINNEGNFKEDDHYLFACTEDGFETSTIPDEIDYFKNKAALDWMLSMCIAEDYYLNLLENGWTPQQARTVLPNSLKTEIVMTANFREWRHVFKLRCDTASHPQMIEIMNMLLAEAKKQVPVIFDDL